MNTVVRQLAKLSLLALFFAATSVIATAQDTGTVTINGNVSTVFSIRYNSHSMIGSATSPGQTVNDPLDFTINLGDLAPVTGATFQGGRVTMILRSNAAYALDGAATCTGCGTAADGDITLSDFGFGLTSFANSGANVVGDPAATASADAAANNFTDDPSAATVTDGYPVYTTSLDDISSQTELFAGGRISRGGSLNSPTNGLLVEGTYVVLPQFFTPVSSVSAVVTYTMATP